VAAFLNDAALYLSFAALPFRALELGAGPVGLGALPTLYAGAYMISAARAGKLSDRFSRLALARTGCLLFAAAAAVLAAADSLPALYVTIPGMGVALGLFWSPLQAALSDRVAERDLPRTVSTFNMAWSLGKGTGLVLGGVVADLAAPRIVFLLAALPVLGTALVLPRRSAPVDEPRPGRDAAGAVPIESTGTPLTPAQVRVAWMANALAFGLVGTVNMHAPRLLLAEGSRASAFGVLFGAVFAVQTLTFAALARRHPGPGTPLRALAFGLAAVAVFLAAPTFPWRLLSALPFGVATGLAYDASLHASLRRASGRGRAAGLHEMILGGGSSSLPLLAGLAARTTGSLAAPFVLAGAALLAGLAVSLRVRALPRGAG